MPNPVSRSGHAGPCGWFQLAHATPRPASNPPLSAAPAAQSRACTPLGRAPAPLLQAEMGGGHSHAHGVGASRSPPWSCCAVMVLPPHSGDVKQQQAVGCSTTSDCRYSAMRATQMATRIRGQLRRRRQRASGQARTRAGGRGPAQGARPCGRTPGQPMLSMIMSEQPGAVLCSRHAIRGDSAPCRHFPQLQTIVG